MGGIAGRVLRRAMQGQRRRFQRRAVAKVAIGATMRAGSSARPRSAALTRSAPSAAAPSAAAQPPSTSQIERVLQYEGSLGYPNAWSHRSQQCFASWIANALTSIINQSSLSSNQKTTLSKLHSRVLSYHQALPPERRLLLLDLQLALARPSQDSAPSPLPPAPSPSNPLSITGFDCANDVVAVIAFDFETTGRSPASDRIVEIAAHDVLSSDSFSTLVSPGSKRMSEKASEITGITNAMLQEPHVPSFPLAFQRFQQWVDSRLHLHHARSVVMVAHNGKQFDVKFLEAELSRARELESEHEFIINMPHEWYFADSLIMAKDAHPAATSRSLSTLFSTYGSSEEDQSHRASDDARWLAHVLQGLMRWHDLDTHALREQYSFGLSSQRVTEQAARNKGQFTSANAVQNEGTQQLFGAKTLNGSKSSTWVDKIGDQGEVDAPSNDTDIANTPNQYVSARRANDDVVSSALTCDIIFADPDLLQPVDERLKDGTLEEKWLRDRADPVVQPFTESVEHIVPLGSKTQSFEKKDPGLEIHEEEYETCVNDRLSCWRNFAMLSRYHYLTLTLDRTEQHFWRKLKNDLVNTGFRKLIDVARYYPKRFCQLAPLNKNTPAKEYVYARGTFHNLIFRQRFHWKAGGGSLFTGVFELENGEGIVHVAARLTQSRLERDLEWVERKVNEEQRTQRPQRWHLRGKWRKRYNTEPGIREHELSKRALDNNMTLQLFVDHLDYDLLRTDDKDDEQTQFRPKPSDRFVSNSCRGPEDQSTEKEEPLIDLQAFYKKRSQSEKKPSSIVPSQWRFAMPRICKLLRQTSNAYSKETGIPDELDAFFNDKNSCMMPYLDALDNIHMPKSLHLLKAARERLAMEECMALQLEMYRQRWHQQLTLLRDSDFNLCQVASSRYAETVRSALSFDLTKQQDNALSDIMSDFAAPYPMLRLLQGDVGTGKTLVAALAALAIVEKRWQCAICIPRVQLAKQFRDELKESVFSKLDGTKQPTIAFVGEGTTKKEMDDIRSRLWWNTLDIVVGTTSVQNLAGNFSALGLVVVDEEQKFGSQNKVNFHRLAYKDADIATSAPHYLAMSATPIPRSLALANFGVMNISRMDGLPPAGNGVTTLPRELSEESKQEAMQCVEEAAKNGRQTYVVCSRVEEHNESSQSVSVERMMEEATRRFPQSIQIEQLHTKMPEQEKEQVMQRFKSGDTTVLIASTIVEVGLHVPKATVLLVMDAHNFGLGTLHQLRGRVARGESEGQCFLLYDPKEERVELADAAGEQDSYYDDDEDHGMTMKQVAGDSKEDGEGSEESEGGDGPEKRQQRRDRQTNVARRMRMLQTCTSGFQVAEADLAARNPGEMMSDGSAGTQTGAGTQTALSSLVSLSNDNDLMLDARYYASEYLDIKVQELEERLDKVHGETEKSGLVDLMHSRLQTEMLKLRSHKVSDKLTS